MVGSTIFEMWLGALCNAQLHADCIMGAEVAQEMGDGCMSLDWQLPVTVK